MYWEICHNLTLSVSFLIDFIALLCLKFCFNCVPCESDSFVVNGFA